MKNKLFCTILFLAPLVLFSQENKSKFQLFKQDSVTVINNVRWLNISLGSGITYDPEGIDALVGFSLDYNWITKKYNYYKINVSVNSGIAIFENFEQVIGEVNFMTGKIKKSNNRTIEFTYGLGMVFGNKRLSILSESKGGTSGFSVFLPYTEYEKKKFISMGIPIELKSQWSRLGISVYGNINPYLPQIGGKLSVLIGKNYKNKI